MVKNDNYITILGWMVNELNLKGNELLVYSIIYGFCQSDNQSYSGSLQYLASWTNSTKQGVMKNLKSLEEKGLIEKKESYYNNVKFVSYYATKFNGGMQQSLPNIIYNNNIKEIDNNKLLSKESPKKALNVELFNKFYNAYPKKRNKGDVEKAFIKLNPSEELVDLMIKKINVLKETKQWKDNNGQYIPYPSSFLNKRIWEDEIELKEDPYAEYIRM